MSLCLLFPGQGSQHDAMFAGWDARSSTVTDALRRVVGTDPMRLTTESMHRNTNAQPAIVAYQLAACADLGSVLPDDLMVLGYSVGEIAACSVAGYIEPGAAVELAAMRAALMDRAAPQDSGMLAVRGLPLERIRQIAASFALEVAIENGADHAVLGGVVSVLDAAVPTFQSAGARTVRRLPVSISSHTSHLSSAATPFRDALSLVVTHHPARVLISGIWARPLHSRGEVIDSLAQQLHTCLRFADALHIAQECGATCCLEVGPGDALTQIAEDNIPDVPTRPLHLFKTKEGVGKWIERHR